MQLQVADSALSSCLGLAGEEVKDVTDHTGVGLEELSVATACTDHCSELVALDVENFRPETTGNTNFTGFVLVLVTFGARVSDSGHFTSPVGAINFN